MGYAESFEEAYDVEMITRHYKAGRNYKLDSMENFAYELDIPITEVLDAIYAIEDAFGILLEVDSWKDVIINPYGF